jgi:lactate permease
VLAKMVSPQNLAIGAAAVGLAGKEGDLFRQVILYSIVFVLLMAGLVLLQSGALSFMVP